MKKFKITRRDAKENESIAIGYCQAQSLLKYEEPFAYSAGVYGWSCDYYNIDGVIISTGYAPVGTSANYDTVKEYENKAEAVAYDYENWGNNKTNMRKLLNALIKEIKAEAQR